MEIKKILKLLCEESGVSGNEVCVTDKISELLKDFACIKKDINGNLIAVMGKQDKKKILIDAHIDQIGFIVTQIDDRGFVKISPCGGIDTRVLSGTALKIQGKKALSAVVSCLPPHLSDGGEDKGISKDKLFIDTGLSCEKVKELVSIGDFVTFSDEFTELLNGNVSSPALDNRAGAAALIYCAELLKDIELNCCVEFLFSSKEEVGGMGAKTAAFSSEPEEAIVVDVTFAKQQGFDSGAIKTGDGVMIGLSPILNKNMTNTLKRVADKYEIPYEIEVMAEGTGTNADPISVSKCGVKTALISIPQKNMHTQCEIINTADVERTGKLIFNYIKDEFND